MYTDKNTKQREESEEISVRSIAVKRAKKLKKEGYTEIFVDVFDYRHDFGGYIDKDDLVWINYINI